VFKLLANALAAADLPKLHAQRFLNMTNPEVGVMVSCGRHVIKFNQVRVKDGTVRFSSSTDSLQEMDVLLQVYLNP
jgi:hypothetical protein